LKERLAQLEANLTNAKGGSKQEETDEKDN